MKKQLPYLWIIGGGQLQVPLIQQARLLKLAIIVTDKNPHCLCAPLADRFYAVDIFNLNENIDLLFKLQSEGITLAGILAAGIDANVTAAVLARIAGLPGVDPRAAYLTHNKAAFRAFLMENGFPYPRFAHAANEDEFKAAIKKIGFPLIIKNVDSSASRGTKKFFTPAPWEELAAVFHEAMAVSSTKSALVEELLIGEEQTVESLFDVTGKFHPCFITDRMFLKDNPFAVEHEVRHPTTLSKPQQRELYDLVECIATKLGITIGAAKGDTIWTKRGPYILEMTTRLSGGFDCQYIVPAATGKNVLKAAILTALGKKFPASLLTDTKKRVALSASIWPPENSRIIAIRGIEKAKRMPGFEHFFLNHGVGEIIHPYTDGTKRVCFVIVTGKNEAEARVFLHAILNTIQFVTKPLGR